MSRTRSAQPARRRGRIASLASLMMLCSVSALLVVGGTPTSAAAAPQPSVTVIAVRGHDHHLYAKRSNEKHFRNLGGALNAAPAVVYSKATKLTYYIARGTDNQLYVRTDTTKFTRFAPSRCTYAPSAAVSRSGSLLTVACAAPGSRGTYYAEVIASGIGNPITSKMSYVDGSATKNVHGPAVFYGVDLPLFLSMTALERGNARNVVFYDLTKGPFFDADERCAQQLDAVAANAAVPIITACQSANPAVNGGGNTRSLLVVASGTDPSDYGRATIGQMTGRPGIASTGEVAGSRIYVTSPGGVVYGTILTGSGAASTGFRKVGGSALAGVSAAAVS